MCLSVCPFVYLFVCLSVCPFVYFLSVCPFMYLFVYLFVCLSVCLSVHSFICVCVCLSVCLSVCFCLSKYSTFCLFTGWNIYNIKSWHVWNKEFLCNHQSPTGVKITVVSVFFYISYLSYLKSAIMAVGTIEKRVLVDLNNDNK